MIIEIKKVILKNVLVLLSEESLARLTKEQIHNSKNTWINNLILKLLISSVEMRVRAFIRFSLFILATQFY